jgi:hypothetical protein
MGGSALSSALSFYHSAVEQGQHRRADGPWEVWPSGCEANQIGIGSLRACLDKDRTSSSKVVAIPFAACRRIGSIFLHKPRVAGSIPAPATFLGHHHLSAMSRNLCGGKARLPCARRTPLPQAWQGSWWSG